jgi:hypothetical protein
MVEVFSDRSPRAIGVEDRRLAGVLHPRRLMAAPAQTVLPESARLVKVTVNRGRYARVRSAGQDWT